METSHLVVVKGCGDPVEKLWSFLFAMGFIFFLRASRYIMSFNRESETNVMAVRICVVSPFLLSRAMIYYGPQSKSESKVLPVGIHPSIP